MQSEGGRGSDSCCAHVVGLAFQIVHLCFSYKFTLWHKVKANRTKFTEVNSAHPSLELWACRAKNAPLVSLCGQRNYQKKTLAPPPLLTEGKTLNGDRFLLESDWVSLHSPSPHEVRRHGTCQVVGYQTHQSV